MPDLAAPNDELDRQRRRIAIFLRSLLPAAAEAESAWRETLIRAEESRRRSRKEGIGPVLDRLAREVATERRKLMEQTPFSDDLFRQLADSAAAPLDIVAERPHRLAEILKRLPSPEREMLRRKYLLGLSNEQIATTEGRPTNTVSREMSSLHNTLVSELLESLRDGGPSPPGGAADLGRLTDQLLDKSITDDGRIVLETLLLADPIAQAHYHRHVALVVELEWTYRGEPSLPTIELPPTRETATREWVVTGAFLLTCLLAAVFIILLFTGQLRRW